jgi:hypothetical protein
VLDRLVVGVWSDYGEGRAIKQTTVAPTTAPTRTAHERLRGLVVCVDAVLQLGGGVTCTVHAATLGDGAAAAAGQPLRVLPSTALLTADPHVRCV